MSCRYLTFENRKSLEALYSAGEELSTIAEALGVHLATIYRELIRGDTGKLDQNGRNGYNAELAQSNVQQSLKRRGRKAAANNKTE